MKKLADNLEKEKNIDLTEEQQATLLKETQELFDYSSKFVEEIMNEIDNKIEIMESFTEEQKNEIEPLLKTFYEKSQNKLKVIAHLENFLDQNISNYSSEIVEKNKKLKSLKDLKEKMEDLHRRFEDILLIVEIKNSAYISEKEFCFFEKF
jgi:hypothetical protein